MTDKVQENKIIEWLEQMPPHDRAALGATLATIAHTSCNPKLAISAAIKAMIMMGEFGDTDQVAITIKGDDLNITTQFELHDMSEVPARRH